MESKNDIAGIIILGAIALIVGLVLLQPIATNVEQSTRANSGVATALNTSITISGLVSGDIVELTGQELVTVLGVVNGSTGLVLPTTNYTITECIRSSDAVKGICYTKTTAGNAFPTVNISYTYYPNGYIDDAGGRGLASLIVILAAIAILMVAVWMAVGNKILDFVQ